MKILKPLSFLLTVISIISSCTTKNQMIITGNDIGLSQHGKLLYYNNTPFNGVIEERHANNKLKRHSKYEDGLLNGNTTSWYDDGQKESCRLYVAGEKHGIHAGWWPNGNSKFEYHFSNGQYDGSFKEWYENGKLLHLFEYKEGNEVAAIGWRDNGKTYINFVVRNGRKYGLTNSRLCFTLQDEKGIYQASNNK